MDGVLTRFESRYMRSGHDGTSFVVDPRENFPGWEGAAPLSGLRARGERAERNRHDE